MGQTGTVVSDLAPKGTVRLSSELWSAVAAGGGVIGAGEKVEVVGLDGLILRVSKLE